MKVSESLLEEKKAEFELLKRLSPLSRLRRPASCCLCVIRVTNGDSDGRKCRRIEFAILCAMYDCVQHVYLYSTMSARSRYRVARRNWTPTAVCERRQSSRLSWGVSRTSRRLSRTRNPSHYLSKIYNHSSLINQLTKKN